MSSNDTLISIVFCSLIFVGVLLFVIFLSYANDSDSHDYSLRNFCTKNGYAGMIQYNFNTGQCFSYETNDKLYVSKGNNGWEAERK